MERRQVQQFNGEKAGHPVPTSLLLLAYAQGRSREGALRPTLIFSLLLARGHLKMVPKAQATAQKPSREQCSLESSCL